MIMSREDYAVMREKFLADPLTFRRLEALLHPKNCKLFSGALAQNVQRGIRTAGRADKLYVSKNYRPGEMHSHPKIYKIASPGELPPAKPIESLVSSEGSLVAPYIQKIISPLDNPLNLPFVVRNVLEFPTLIQRLGTVVH